MSDHLATLYQTII